MITEQKGKLGAMTGYGSRPRYGRARVGRPCHCRGPGGPRANGPEDPARDAAGQSGKVDWPGQEEPVRRLRQRSSRRLGNRTRPGLGTCRS